MSDIRVLTAADTKRTIRNFKLQSHITRRLRYAATQRGVTMRNHLEKMLGRLPLPPKGHKFRVVKGAKR